MDTPSTEVFTIELDAASASRIELIARERQLSVSEVIQIAVMEYLKQQDEHIVLEQGAQDSLSHYQRTGLHLTHEEVDAWLVEIEAGNFDAELPECHQ
jgi:predicted transcriptional regulator